MVSCQTRAKKTQQASLTLPRPPLAPCSTANPDLEWRVVYVGTAENDTYDQELESVLVGPVPVGINKFVLQV